jgi:hypothetical protein
MRPISDPFPNKGDGKDWHNFRRELNRYERIIQKFEGEIAWMDSQRIEILKTTLINRMRSAKAWNKRSTK